MQTLVQPTHRMRRYPSVRDVDEVRNSTYKRVESIATEFGGWSKRARRRR
jgi:hypothetical protein